MKKLVKQAAQALGQRFVPDTKDPVLRDLLDAYAELRLRSNDAAYCQHRLSRVAALAHLRDLLKRYSISCVLDVGANTGQFGRTLRKVGYTGRIVSFEPMARAREELESLAREDGSWKVRDVALGKMPEQRTLQIFADDTFSSLHTIRAEASVVFGQYVEKTGTQRVSVECLDDLWPSLFDGSDSGPVLLKTDTQGHDLEVLQGAERSLQSVVAILSEASIERLYENSPSLADLAAYLERQGYRASGYYPFSHRRESLAMVELDAFFVRVPREPRA
jgi:FkbM family methyltransferase